MRVRAHYDERLHACLKQLIACACRCNAHVCLLLRLHGSFVSVVYAEF